ncbi:hypothetical protein MN608_03581 [Microdochium nivale]|nr:hypothetical protein MN608_03581 [Microdochium nivale]
MDDYRNDSQHESRHTSPERVPDTKPAFSEPSIMLHRWASSSSRETIPVSETLQQPRDQSLAEASNK